MFHSMSWGGYFPFFLKLLNGLKCTDIKKRNRALTWGKKAKIIMTDTYTWDLFIFCMRWAYQFKVNHGYKPTCRDIIGQNIIKYRTGSTCTVYTT